MDIVVGSVLDFLIRHELAGLFLIMAVGLTLLYVVVDNDERLSALYFLQSLATALAFFLFWFQGRVILLKELTVLTAVLISGALFVICMCFWYRKQLFEKLKNFVKQVFTFASSHSGLFIIGAIVVVMGVLLYLSDTKPELQPFVVYVDLQGIDTASEEETVNELKSDLGKAFEIRQTPFSRGNANLEINLDLDCPGSGSEENELYWGTEDVHERLSLYLDGWNAALGCDKEQSRKMAVAIIRFAYGLELMHNSDAYPLVSESMVEAEQGFKDLAKDLESDLDQMAKTMGEREANDLVTDRLLDLGGRVLTCAKLMAVVADGPTVTEENDKELIKIISGAYKYSSLEQEHTRFCLAQTYYWRGRGKLQSYVATQGEGSPDTPVRPAIDTLREALLQFDLAIATAQSEDGRPGVATACSSPVDNQYSERSKGYQWVYYLFCGLTHYRRGNLAMANTFTTRAAAAYGDSVVSELPKDAIDFLHARIQLDQQNYNNHVAYCGDRKSDSESDPAAGWDWQSMSALSEGDSSFALLASIHKVLYRFAETDASLTPDELEVLITDLSQDRHGLAGIVASGEVDPTDPQLFLDVVRAQLYMLSDQPAAAIRTLQGLDSKEYFSNLGRPAYVIPLAPRATPDTICSQESYDLSRPLIFYWLLRNRLDEPIFEFSWPGRTNDSTSKGSEILNQIDNALGVPDGLQTRNQFFVRLGSDKDDNQDIPLSEVGYGLFESAPVDVITTTLTARPHQDGIQITGEVDLALVYRVEGEAREHLLPIGTLPVRTLGRLELDTQAYSVKPPVRQAHLESCRLPEMCYHRVKVEVTINAPGFNLKGLQLTNSPDDAAPLLGAILYEQRPDDPNWRKVSGLSPLILEQNSPGHFTGLFPAIMFPDTRYHVKVVVYGQDGEEIKEVNSVGRLP